jgi:hypothetical protein
MPRGSKQVPRQWVIVAVWITRYANSNSPLLVSYREYEHPFDVFSGKNIHTRFKDNIEAVDLLT